MNGRGDCESEIRPPQARQSPSPRRACLQSARPCSHNDASKEQTIRRLRNSLLADCSSHSSFYLSSLPLSISHSSISTFSTIPCTTTNSSFQQYSSSLQYCHYNPSLTPPLLNRMSVHMFSFLVGRQAPMKASELDGRYPRRPTRAEYQTRRRTDNRPLHREHLRQSTRPRPEKRQPTPRRGLFCHVGPLSNQIRRVATPNGRAYGERRGEVTRRELSKKSCSARCGNYTE